MEEKIIKAACFLINVKGKSVALVYREKQKDYSFPKWHLENNETIEQCAIREIEEETKRCHLILNSFEPFVEKYISSRGENCVCYMYYAIDNGQSINSLTDTHKTFFILFDDVEKTLSYQSLKDMWNIVQSNITKIADSCSNK